MKILAFLQNQWFKNPDKVRAIYARNPELRNDLIRRFLFMGCASGRNLESAFGEALCREIIWEESSPQVGGFSGSNFGGDADHVRAAIEKHAPDVVLCFGKVASEVVRSVCCEVRVPHPAVMYAPHPASRQNPMPELRAIANTLKTQATASL